MIERKVGDRMKEILVIGCGFAGVTAAVKCAQAGDHVTLAAPMQSERAQSVMAMGGINAALNTKGENDSIEEHYQDTMAGGCYINNPKAVKKLTEDAPEVVKWLEKIGVNFDRDENNQIQLRNFGGQKKKRTAYSGAHTGKQIMTALIAECRKHEAAGRINRLNGYRFLSLVRNQDDECIGAVLLQESQQELKLVQADAVVMATGAPNAVFGKTSGSAVNDGTASALLFLQGVQFANLEMVQYHPTTLETSGKRMLITEAARGQGGRLYTLRNGEKWYFMEEWYPERGALMPRDVVSRSIYKVCDEMKLGIDGKKQVYLDISFLEPKVIDYALDEVVQTCLKYRNIDPHKEPIPVYPGVHYFMGGIKTDEFHRTNVKRLFAAGECSSQYHGANRLGGNSILGAIHGGLIAAQMCNSVSELGYKANKNCYEKALKEEKDKLNAFSSMQKGSEGSTYSLKIKQDMAQIIKDSMGIFRERKKLEEASKKLETLSGKCSSISNDEKYYDYVTTKAVVTLAQAFVESALERKESRGAHQRLDYPETDDKQFKGNVVAKWNQGHINVTCQNIEED